MSNASLVLFILSEFAIWLIVIDMKELKVMLSSKERKVLLLLWLVAKECKVINW